MGATDTPTSGSRTPYHHEDDPTGCKLNYHEAEALVESDDPEHVGGLRMLPLVRATTVAVERGGGGTDDGITVWVICSGSALTDRYSRPT
jgi:hypothetical protein